MNTRRLHAPTVVLAVLGIGLNTALGGEPSRAVEEIVVNGTNAAAEYRANQARFEAEMAAFAANVEARYRHVLQTRLERLVRQELAGGACDGPGVRS